MATTKVPEVRDIMRIERIGENVFYLPTAYMYYEVLTAKIPRGVPLFGQ